MPKTAMKLKASLDSPSKNTTKKRCCFKTKKKIGFRLLLHNNNNLLNFMWVFLECFAGVCESSEGARAGGCWYHASSNSGGY